MPQVLPGTIFQISPQVAVEYFDDGALLLKLKERQLVELNPTASDVLKHTDGLYPVSDVARRIAADYQISEELAFQDVTELYEQLTDQEIVEIIEFKQRKDGNSMDQVSAPPRYLCNPDVVLREEDEDGGLLFNPDTNQVKVVNPTALFIWQQCGQARTLDEIVAEVQKGFDEVPLDEVAKDVQEFIEGMLATGFIGTLVE